MCVWGGGGVSIASKLDADRPNILLVHNRWYRLSEPVYLSGGSVYGMLLESHDMREMIISFHPHQADWINSDRESGRIV